MSALLNSAQLNLFFHAIEVGAVPVQKLRQLVRGRYLPPHNVANPEGGKAIFLVSENGNSHIILSESHLTLNVNFTPDWKRDSRLGEEYLIERIPLLFALLAACGVDDLIYAGAVTDTTTTTEADDNAIIRAIANYIQGRPLPNQSDMSIQTSEIIADTFYRNITVSNYRIHPAGVNPMPQLRQNYQAATERGVSVLVDYNSRHAYNANKGVTVDESLVQKMVKEAVSSSQTVANSMLSGLQGE